MRWPQELLQVAEAQISSGQKLESTANAHRPCVANYLVKQERVQLNRDCTETMHSELLDSTSTNVSLLSETKE